MLYVMIELQNGVMNMRFEDLTHEQYDRYYALLYRIGYHETVKKLEKEGLTKFEIHKRIEAFIKDGVKL